MMCPASSSRWCPTPEQLMILEEMYRGGIRTPNASQIQQITAHLSYYGKIEGKNVFYWFQNHKARDRQKLRRKLSKEMQQQQQQQHQLPQIQQQNQQNHHHHLLHYLDSPPPSALQPLYHYNSATFLPQMGIEGASPQRMNYMWKVDIPENNDGMVEEKSKMRMYSRDNWMMMVDMCPTSPCCSRPLKTLQLFPITATNLREESTTSTQFSCPTTTI
ncbi:hypothetical protein L1049_013673 [Liquidambar formosana]|uniref:Homeobox domain-containing protein n=1 Tax=Liquidambar formosana TaxID=63359 RepID=A0AAP0RL50_LIQFO